MEIYTVKQGDTIFSIAAQFGVSAARIITDNGISRPAQLSVGQALLILFPDVTHVVSAGETLSSIAADYGTSYLELLRNNPYAITEPFLSVGQELVISYRGGKSGGRIVTCGFAYPNVRRETLEKALPYMTYLIIFGYGFRPDGTLILPDDREIIDRAHAYGTAVLLSLSAIEDNNTFSSSKLVPLLTDLAFQAEVLDKMAAEILARGAQGMDIDMEYIPAAYRAEFAAFAQNAADRLHAAGLILNIDLAPKYSADQTGTLYEAHDYALLGAAADYVFLMTYEWGYMFGPPMAVAPINNVERVLNYALTEIPREKLLLGMPNYAYDWPLPYESGVTEAAVIGNVYAVSIAQRYGAEIFFDERAETPYFPYSEGGQEHIVWFEDPRSMAAKYGLIRDNEIGGGGYWNLMRPFPAGFLLLNYIFEIERVYP